MNNWIEELVVGQVVYLQKLLSENKVRLSPVLVDRLDEQGGIVFKHFPIGLLPFNKKGEIVLWGSDTTNGEKIVPAPEGTNFNDPDQVIEVEL